MGDDRRRLALYTARIDGTHLRRVSPFVASGRAARPDAQTISWSCGGSRLAATPVDETQPALSPDGTCVAYVRQDFAETCRGCATTTRWTIAPDGTHVHRPTHDLGAIGRLSWRGG